MTSLTFRTYDDISITPPVPASEELPVWWVRMQPTTPEGGITVRQCMPFLDAMALGFMLTLPFDVFVEWKDDKPCFSCPDAPWANVVGQLPGQMHGDVYRFMSLWGVDISEDYSVLYTHPLNRHDLPFRAFSGVIDGGYKSPPNIPFTIIGQPDKFPAGMPIATALPFLRESFSSSVAKLSAGELENDQMVTRMHEHAYRHRYRADRREREVAQ